MSKPNISDSKESSSKELNKNLAENISLHIIVEEEVDCTPFGTITFNMILKDGLVAIETINITKNRRKRYA